MSFSFCVKLLQLQLVTVVSSETLTTITSVKMAPTSVGLVAASSQHDVVQPPLILRSNERSCWPCQYATAATSVPDAFSGFHQLCHRSSSGGFTLSQLSLPPIFYVRVHWFVPLQPSEVYPWQVYIPPGIGP